MNPAFFTPHGQELYDQHHHWLAGKYPGTITYPLRDMPGAGVVTSLRGDYPGAVSGVTYYRDVVVTGTLNPDATGTYTAAGMWNGAPYYRRGGDNWYLYVSDTFSASSRYEISSALSWIPPAANRWRAVSVSTVTATYSNLLGTATGTPTVANVTNSGVYLFVPSGVTLQSAGPPLAGEMVKAAGFSAPASGIISCGATPFSCDNAFTFCAWVNYTNTSYATNQNCFSGSFSSTQRFAVGVNSGVLRASYYKGSTFYSQDSAGFTSGWHHICATKPAGITNPTIYVDGIPTGTNTASDIGTRASNTMTIGGAVTVGFMNGSLAYATISPAAWSAADVRLTYEKGIAR